MCKQNYELSIPEYNCKVGDYWQCMNSVGNINQYCDLSDGLNNPFETCKIKVYATCISGTECSMSQNTCSKVGVCRPRPSLKPTTTTLRPSLKPTTMTLRPTIKHTTMACAVGMENDAPVCPPGFYTLDQRKCFSLNNYQMGYSLPVRAH